jgi:hypothetical protein
MPPIPSKVHSHANALKRSAAFWLAFAVACATYAAEPAPPVNELTGANRASAGFTMAQVGPGVAVLTTSLSIPEDGGNHTMLVRAAGPALSAFGMTPALAHPAITLFKASGEQVATNDDWANDAENVRRASLDAGTFPFPAASRDAALVTTLAPGNYTVQVSSRDGDTGIALLEIYDLSASAPGIAVGAGPGSVALRLNEARRSLEAQQLLVHLPLIADFADASSQHRPTQVRGVQIRNGAAWFDGKDSGIVLPHVALNRRAFSVAMWVKLEDDFPGIGLVHQYAAHRRNQHFHLVLRDATPRLGFYNNDLRTGKTVAPRDGWTHLVFQYNGREQEVWVNGQRTGVRAARPYLGTSGEFQIGRAPRWSNIPAHDFKGGLRDLRVYSRALAPMEIQALAKP